MRILLYTQWCSPEPAFKAIPFARELCRRGHEVRILTGFPNYPGGRLYPGYRVRPWMREVLEDVPVLRTALYPSHDRSSLRRMLNYASFAASSAPALLLGRGWRPEVVCVYNLVTLGAVAALGRWLRGIPYVIDVQDLWPDSIFSSGMGARWMRAPVERLCRLAYGAAARVVVLSPGFQRALIARGVSAARLRVIYNWCDESALAGLTEIAPDPVGLGFAGRFNLVYAGNLGRMQGLEAVIDAAAIAGRSEPRIRFVFLGNGVELEALRNRAAAIAPDHTLFLPARPLREALLVQRSADALVLHLRDDPLVRVTIPSKTQAYLAVGRPILAGVPGDAADLVARAGAGLICQPGDAAAIADAAVRLARLPPDELAAMGRRGAGFYRDQLSFRRGVEAFEQVFAEACGAP